MIGALRARLVGVVVSGVVLSVASAAAAHAADGPKELLARKYSPIMMLRAQENPPCDSMWCSTTRK